ncbi:unnamed protein product, partial [Amoebophrya sp. A120]
DKQCEERTAFFKSEGTSKYRKYFPTFLGDAVRIMDPLPVLAMKFAPKGLIEAASRNKKVEDHRANARIIAHRKKGGSSVDVESSCAGGEAGSCYSEDDRSSEDGLVDEDSDDEHARRELDRNINLDR